MAAGKGQRWGLIALVVLAVLIVGGIVGFRVAVGVLKGKVAEALGPESEIADIRVGWASVDVRDLRIKGPRGWPAADTLRAERVVIVPSLCSVLSRQIGVRSITIFKPYLSALRTQDGQPTLKNKVDKIAVNFVLEGDVNNPQFSLNETLTTRLASSLAEGLGVSLGGVAKGVGALGESGVEAAGKAAKGVGGSVQRLFGGQKKRWDASLGFADATVCRPDGCRGLRTVDAAAAARRPDDLCVSGVTPAGDTSHALATSECQQGSRWRHRGPPPRRRRLANE